VEGAQRACGAEIRGAVRRGAPSTDDHFDTPFMRRLLAFSSPVLSGQLLFSVHCAKLLNEIYEKKKKKLSTVS